MSWPRPWQRRVINAEGSADPDHMGKADGTDVKLGCDSQPPGKFVEKQCGFPQDHQVTRCGVVNGPCDDTALSWVTRGVDIVRAVSLDADLTERSVGSVQSSIANVTDDCVDPARDPLPSLLSLRPLLRAKLCGSRSRTCHTLLPSPTQFMQGTRLTSEAAFLCPLRAIWSSSMLSW